MGLSFFMSFSKYNKEKEQPLLIALDVLLLYLRYRLKWRDRNSLSIFILIQAYQSGLFLYARYKEDISKYSVIVGFTM